METVELFLKMRCDKCGKEMHLFEFLTYAEAYLLKAIVIASVPFVLAAIKNLLLTPTRGLINDTMAGLANNFKIKCPKCKKRCCWEALSESNKGTVVQLAGQCEKAEENDKFPLVDKPTTTKNKRAKNKSATVEQPSV